MEGKKKRKRKVRKEKEKKNERLFFAAGVGKTSIIVRYVENVVNRPINPTIGACFFTCKLNIADTEVKLQVRSRRFICNKYVRVRGRKEKKKKAEKQEIKRQFL